MSIFLFFVFFCFLCMCQSILVKIGFGGICLSKCTSFVKSRSRDICLSLLPTYIKPLPPVAGFWCYPLPKFVLLKCLFMGFFWLLPFWVIFWVFGLHYLYGYLVFDIWFFLICFFVIWFFDFWFVRFLVFMLCIYLK